MSDWTPEDQQKFEELRRKREQMITDKKNKIRELFLELTPNEQETLARELGYEKKMWAFNHRGFGDTSK